MKMALLIHKYPTHAINYYNILYNMRVIFVASKLC